MVEDQPIILKKWFWFRKQIVEPFTGARYFGEHLKVPNSDHSTIAKPDSRDAPQHRLLCHFINDILNKPPNKPPSSSVKDNSDSKVSCWNIPFSQNPFFTGRDNVLKNLKETLTEKGAAALSGLGGIGKTQVAVEYAYQYREGYAAVLWVSANSHDTILSSFGAIASVLKLPEKDAQDDQLTVNAVKRWLENTPGWLLIFDNADDLALIRKFLPTKGQGHLLLTTRTQAMGGIARRVEIKTLPETEGALLLLRRADIISANGLLVTVPETDRKIAQAISREMGGLPLALDQAGAFIEETPSTLAEYHNLYLTEGKVLRDQRGQLAADHLSVSITFALAFRMVANVNPASADLLRLCAFLHPDEIPELIFTEGAPYLGETLVEAFANSLSLIQTIKDATRFSLLQRDLDKKSLSIHRVVQEVLKDGMDSDSRHLWAKRTVFAVGQAFPDVKFKTWDLCERLTPHALGCSTLIEQYVFEFPEAANLLNKAGVYLRQRVDPTAESLLQQALAMRENILRPDHPEVATSLQELASFYHYQQRDAKAKSLSKRALAIREKVLPPEHLELATSFYHLGLLYADQGDLDKAGELYDRALAIREKTLSPEHPDVAIIILHIGLLYLSGRSYAKAESLIQRALAIQEKTLGLECPEVVTSLNWLAILYEAQGQNEKVEALYKHVLAIREKVLPPEHPEVATSLYNLGYFYHDNNKYVEAEPLYQRALAIREKFSIPGYVGAATVLEKYACLLRGMGRDNEAASMEDRARSIREKHA